jgi:hypothetical protein
MTLKFVYFRNKLAYFKEDYCPLGYGIVFSGRCLDVFRRNGLPPSSVWNREPSVENVTSYACRESCGLNWGPERTNRRKENGVIIQGLIFYPENGGNVFLRIVGKRTSGHAPPQPKRQYG